MKRISLLIIAIIFTACGTKNNQLKLPSIIGSNMVLQQKSEAAIWGWSKQGETLSIRPSWGEVIHISANDRGEWKTNLNTPKAGGPYSIEIEGNDTTITLSNVLIGEVWLCSGQSNMEMPLQGWMPNAPVANSEAEIKAAKNSKLRLFTVTKSVSLGEEKDCSGEWNELNPLTAKSFSATAYFFGKNLQEKLGVPVGLIHSSWGGTPAEAWTSRRFLKDVPGYEDFSSKLKDFMPKQEKFTAWLNTLDVIKIKDMESPTEFVDINFNDKSCNKVDFNDSAWSDITLPELIENTEVGSFDGAVWFRKVIDVPDNWIGQNAVIELGAIDDMDATFINGKKIGGYEISGKWQTKRIYNVEPAILKAGKNLIAVRMIDTQGGGGFTANKDEMKIYLKNDKKEIIKLSGSWKYLPVAEFRNGQFYVYGEDGKAYQSRPKMDISLDSHTPTALYNAMIKPLVPYTIKGAIWYQGESNVGRADQYKKLFPAMIESWRSSWEIGPFSFYFVQIAPYNYSGANNSESAYLRDAQFYSYKNVENSGIVSTLDIGDGDNIHPAQKQEVGKRLALWALAKDYGNKNLIYSGPLYNEMKVQGNRAILSFTSVGSGLAIDGKVLKGFTIAGKNKKFVSAKAVIKGNNVIVYNSRVKTPVAVRYSWKNVPSANLINSEGLPAPTFRTDNWSE